MKTLVKLATVGVLVIFTGRTLNAQVFELDLTATPTASGTVPNPTHIKLQPNLPNQTVDIYVENTGPTGTSKGVDPAFTVGDGSGPAIISGYNFLGTPYATPGLIGGLTYTFGSPVATFFASHTTPNGNFATFTGGAPPINTPKLLTLVFDTTGFSSGSWPIVPQQAGIDLMIVDGAVAYPLTFTAGTITIVPEPSAYAALSGLALLAFAGYRRFRR